MDVFSKEKRSKVMAAIRSKNTRPEIIVRKYLFAKGFRFRINHPRLPGHPDIVMRKYRTCIFVNGCFWHGHDCQYGHLPKTNVVFWENKINRNRERDREEQRKLAQMGWHCIIVWECELKPSERDRTLQSLEYTLNRIFLENNQDRMGICGIVFVVAGYGAGFSYVFLFFFTGYEFFFMIIFILFDSLGKLPGSV